MPTWNSGRSLVCEPAADREVGISMQNSGELHLKEDKNNCSAKDWLRKEVLIAKLLETHHLFQDSVWFSAFVEGFDEFQSVLRFRLLNLKIIVQG